MRVKRNETTWLSRGWQPVAIGYCPSKKALARTMKQLAIAPSDYPNNPFDMPSAGGWTAEFINTRKQLAIVVVIQHDASDDWVATIVHESAHVWQFICQHIGEHKPGIEMEAYSIQHIFELLYAAHRAHRKFKK